MDQPYRVDPYSAIVMTVHTYNTDSGTVTQTVEAAVRVQECRDAA